MKWAFDTMPGALGFLIMEIPGFFSHSALRREEYQVG